MAEHKEGKEGKQGREGKQGDDKVVTKGTLRKALSAVVQSANAKFASLGETQTALAAQLGRILTAVERLSTNIEAFSMKEREMTWKAKLAPKGSLAVPLRRHLQMALAEGKWTEYNMTNDERADYAGV